MTDSSSFSSAAAPTTTGTGNDRTFAILVHLGGLFTSWLAPLIVYLIRKSDPQTAFSTANAREALNWQITVFIGIVAGFILSFVIIGIFVIWALLLMNLVVSIVAAVKASNGQVWRYPMSLRLIKD